QNRFMKRSGFPDCAGINAVVEEQNQRCAPIPTNGNRQIPSTWSLHHVRREVKCVDFRLGQIMATSDIELILLFRKSEWDLDKLLVPGPRDDCSQMLARLISSPSGIGSFVVYGAVINPIQEFADFPSAKMLNGHTAAPSRPFSDCRKILRASSMR